jgi:Trp operon repressor
MPLRRLKTVSDSGREALLEELRKFLHSREEVIFALLYGSMVDSEFQEKYGIPIVTIARKPTIYLHQVKEWQETRKRQVEGRLAGS